MNSQVKILIVLCCGILSHSLVAQENDYTQYYANMPAVNAGFTGMEDYFDLRMGVREGWNSFGIKDSNLFLSAYGTLNSKSRAGKRNNSLRISNPTLFNEIQHDKKFRRRHGIGGMVTSRTLDPYKSIGASVNYAYHVPLSGKLNISLGAKVGYSNQRIDFSGLTVRDDVNDQFYQSLIQSAQGTQNTVIADFGTVLYSRKFFLGVSSQSLVAKKMNGDQLFNMNDGVRYRLQTGGSFGISPEFELSPGGIVTYQEGYDLRWSLNVRLRYKEFIYLGSAYEADSKISMLFGVVTPSLTFNYSYDMYTSALNNFNVNTHEIVMGLVLFNKFKIRPNFW
ncbi:MAG: PorP/SprF family type IX secretion system membrane protein [Cyclobacteriaceae bacterium]|nr:PorP/SprF family type IX secretion system membrane protein [Cyclobacteriaceae bacterium]